MSASAPPNHRAGPQHKREDVPDSRLQIADIFGEKQTHQLVENIGEVSGAEALCLSPASGRGRNGEFESQRLIMTDLGSEDS